MIELNENIYFKNSRGFITTIIFVAGLCIEYTAIPMADLRGVSPPRVNQPPPPGPKCSQCHAASWKMENLAKLYLSVPPGGSAPLPIGNPGFALEFNIPIQCQ